MSIMFLQEFDKFIIMMNMGLHQNLQISRSGGLKIRSIFIFQNYNEKKKNY